MVEGGTGNRTTCHCEAPQGPRRSPPSKPGRLTHPATELAGEAPRLAEWLAETVACYMLGRQDVRRTVRSTNAVERHHEEVRRRTRVIWIFPHEASLQRWLIAQAMEANDRWRV